MNLRTELLHTPAVVRADDRFRRCVGVSPAIASATARSSAYGAAGVSLEVLAKLVQRTFAASQARSSWGVSVSPLANP